MKAWYLLRFDDVCPTMNWVIWDRIEEILDKYNIRPILAVIPDNRYDRHYFSLPREDFWEWLFQKQREDYAIGMHGYQHLCLTNEPGLGSSLKSEFAGLPFEKQKERLEKSFEIFNRHQIIPQIFVAPWNTLDENTLRALIDLDLKVVSNGLYLTPCIKSGIIWIPQQLVRFRPMPFGIYTICFHPSSFREDELKKFEEDCYRFHSNIISLKEVLDQSYIRIRDINLINKIFPKMWRSIINFRESIKK